MTKQIVPIRSTTQKFIEIEAIEKNIVLFTDGSASLVVATSAVNFGLLSEKEQEALIYAYAGFLNSLSFPVQLLIRSQHKDISAYLAMLEEAEKKQTNTRLGQSIHGYRQFIATTVKEKDVLDKKFYVVIPFARIELGTAPKVMFGNTSQGLPYPKDYILERATTTLEPKRDHIMRLLTRLGLRAHQLADEQLTKFFYEIYNPGIPMPDINNSTNPTRLQAPEAPANGGQANNK